MNNYPRQRRTNMVVVSIAAIGCLVCVCILMSGIGYIWFSSSFTAAVLSPTSPSAINKTPTSGAVIPTGLPTSPPSNPQQVFRFHLLGVESSEGTGGFKDLTAYFAFENTSDQWYSLYETRDATLVTSEGFTYPSSATLWSGRIAIPPGFGLIGSPGDHGCLNTNGNVLTFGIGDTTHPKEIRIPFYNVDLGAFNNPSRVNTAMVFDLNNVEKDMVFPTDPSKSKIIKAGEPIEFPNIGTLTITPPNKDFDISWSFQSTNAGYSQGIRLSFILADSRGILYGGSGRYEAYEIVGPKQSAKKTIWESPDRRDAVRRLLRPSDQLYLWVNGSVGSDAIDAVVKMTPDPPGVATWTSASPSQTIVRCGVGGVDPLKGIVTSTPVPTSPTPTVPTCPPGQVLWNNSCWNK